MSVQRGDGRIGVQVDAVGAMNIGVQAAHEAPQGALERHEGPSVPGEDEDVARLAREEKKVRQREGSRLKSRLSSLEQRISRLEAQQADLARKLEEACSTGAAPTDVRTLTGEFDAVRDEVTRLYAEWTQYAIERGNASSETRNRATPSELIRPAARFR